MCTACNLYRFWAYTLQYGSCIWTAVYCIIRYICGALPVNALIDSGASDNFIDKNLLQKLSYIPKTLKHPIQLELFNRNTAADGLITEAVSLTPILFTKKKDGSLRLCVDYRGLNQITKWNHYPLPLIGNLLDQLQSAKVFTKIDLHAGYNNIRIAPRHEWKMAFQTRYGLFEYMVMLFGMTNSPTTFQHFMNDIFQDMADLYIIVYLDDILIFSANTKEHWKHVRAVLQCLQEHNLHIRVDKCDFHTDTVEYLSFIVSPKGVAIDPAKYKSIQTWPQPHSVQAVQSFLGFANFYRRFIHDYSTIVTPLIQLTRKDVTFKWDDNCQSAFDALKTAFTTTPVLMHFNLTWQIMIKTDASDYAVAAILSQVSEDGQLHLVAFHSRTMSPAKWNYDIYDKELLAIWEAFKHW